jgi:hypothetical protein
MSLLDDLEVGRTFADTERFYDDGDGVSRHDSAAYDCSRMLRAGS